MYDFLAPWGVLVPAISAFLVYIYVAEIRRRRQLELIQAPN